MESVEKEKNRWSKLHKVVVPWLGCDAGNAMHEQMAAIKKVDGVNTTWNKNGSKTSINKLTRRGTVLAALAVSYDVHFTSTTQLACHTSSY
jgi:hypothetical protein